MSVTPTNDSIADLSVLARVLDFIYGDEEPDVDTGQRIIAAMWFARFRVTLRKAKAA